MNIPAPENHTDVASGDASQPARKRNIEALTAFFRSGIKPAESHGKLGIELEQTIVRADGSPVSYSEENGVAHLLEQLRESYPQATVDEEGDLLGVARPGEAITIEPAAQIELSAGPFDDLKKAQETFTAYRKTLDDLLAPKGMHVIAQGYHPTATARSLDLIPKRRYAFMNRYLGAKDIYGPCMMRGSASTQISIDYTSEQDCLRKMRIAYALTPILSLICDNSPVFEGKPRSHKLMRTDIWRHTDSDRCGLVPGALSSGFTFEDYAEYVLDTPAIVAPDEDEGWRYCEQTFGRLYADKPMTRKQVEHAVSMQFPDVRLKTYLEIRPADSMPIPYVIAYAALIKGLFYNESNLQQLEALFADVDDDAFEMAKDALMEHGYNAHVYGAPVADLCDRVIGLAENGLSPDDRALLEPLSRLVAQRVTLADLAEGESKEA